MLWCMKNNINIHALMVYEEHAVSFVKSNSEFVRYFAAHDAMHVAHCVLKIFMNKYAENPAENTLSTFSSCRITQRIFSNFQHVAYQDCLIWKRLVSGSSLWLKRHNFTALWLLCIFLSDFYPGCRTLRRIEIQ